MVSIPVGGSVFVFIIIKVLRSLAESVYSSEQLRIELQAAERANKAKTVFLSNMSHDISNAYKFTPEGGTVSVILTEDTREGTGYRYERTYFKTA